MKIGLISDTHGLLRPEVFTAFAGVEHIVHAGDLGDTDVLIELQAIAPVTAVWGNVDGPEVRARVAETVEVELGGARIRVVHGHQLGSPTPSGLLARWGGGDLLVFGHTHRPLVERHGEVMVTNPGSAGPRRFGLPVTVALAEVGSGGVRVELVPLLRD